MKVLYNILGVLMVALGVLGIVLPVLPTTPFLLLALWFFGRGSDRLRRWLLENKLFGSYIRAYRSGRGLPVRMMVWTLLFLWIVISISIWRVDPMWLKISLLLIALAVTTHILTLGRHRIIILVPTAAEAKYLDDVVLCGVGMAETAATLVRVLKRRPRLVILGGIAGAYSGHNIAIGDCVMVASERVSGLPDVYDIAYNCPWAEAISLPRAMGYTVNSVGDRGRNNEEGPQRNSSECAGEGLPEIENMEGAVFFAMCEAAGVRFLEVRAISNLIKDCREDWRIDAAALSLSAGINKILHEIEA